MMIYGQATFGLHDCPNCGGDVVLESWPDANEWTCLQCARTYPAHGGRERDARERVAVS